MSKRFRRTPKNYDGTEVTSHKVNELLPLVLKEVNEAFEDRPDLILAAWPEIIGVQLSPMTQAVSFMEGILTVKVKNSTLYSLLSQRDKPKILNNLRSKFPNIHIKTIYFRMS